MAGQARADRGDDPDPFVVGATGASSQDRGAVDSDCRHGVIFANHPVLTNGIMLADGIMLSAGIMLADGIVVGSGIMLADRVVLGDGIMLADGTVLGDGIMLADGTVLGDGIMLADMTQPNQPRVTFARSGNLVTDEENHNFVLTLSNGSTHVVEPLSPDRYSFDTFDTTTISVPMPQAPPKQVPADLAQDQDYFLDKLRRHLSGAIDRNSGVAF